MQDLEHNKQVIRDTWERVFPSGDVDGLDALVADDVVQRGQRPDEASGLDGLKATMRWLATVFSDQRWEIHDLVAEGPIVVCRLTHHGRHTGDLMGIPPDGRLPVRPLRPVRPGQGRRAVERPRRHDADAPAGRHPRTGSGRLSARFRARPAGRDVARRPQTDDASTRYP